MALTEFFTWLENTPVGVSIRESAWWFPILETIHVIAIVLVAGSIMIVDLRLLNWASRKRSVSQLTQEVLPLTWGAFSIAAITGLLLFSSAAVRYSTYLPFQLKMGLLVFAGLNMGVFHLITYRNVAAWDQSVPPPAAKWAGALSLLTWFGVIACGRWIGFV